MSAKPVLVVRDPRFARHLEGVFHLENPKRLKAFETVLQHASLAGRWVAVEPRPAVKAELAWVHTAEHIARIEQTAGCQLTSFDLDTQATAHSWETACLAVGGVFSLADRVMRGDAERGFAFVRPPGHHAAHLLPGRGLQVEEAEADPGDVRRPASQARLPDII